MGRAGRTSLSSLSTYANSSLRDRVLNGHRQDELATFFLKPPFLFSYGAMETCPFQTLQGKQEQWKDIGSFWRLYTGLPGSYSRRWGGRGILGGGTLLRYVGLAAQAPSGIP